MIVKTIKEHGFFVKKKQTVATQTTTYENHAQYTQTTKNESVSGYNRQTSTTSTQTPLYPHKNSSEVNATTADDKFNGIDELLRQTVIGQNVFTEKLTLAFKRPFIVGYDNFKPKNNIFIFGKTAHGKHLGVNTIAKILKSRKIINHDNLSILDMRRYGSNAQHDLFLSDLYKALYEHSEIVLFNNFEKCHVSMLEVLSSLSQTGTFVMNKRYALSGGNLIEATGALIQNTISQISANGKFFIFVSEKEKRIIPELFGSKFMSCVGDIMTLDEFSEADLRIIVGKLLEKFISKSKEILLFQITTDTSVTDKIISEYHPQSGIQSLIEYIQNEIYKPLSEYKLKTPVKNMAIQLKATKTNIVCIIDENIINLSSILDNRDFSGIEEVKKELASIIGLTKVKEYVLSLEDNLQIQKLRESRGFKAANVSMHMIFTGNPGTGKTTIARVVAKYLKALGVLSSGQLREVTRNDLVGQYVGHTAKTTNDVIKSAIGGVLFIDEAYSLCRDKHDTFGLEAIDTLVKAMEDYRDDLVVILAGYEDEMREFLKTNSGLKSRFPNIVNFDDYTPTEMYDISLITAKSKGYIIAEDCKEGLLRLFEKSQIRGKNDSGNGRLVRNIIESALLNQSKRLLKNPEEQMDLLSSEDFNFENHTNFDLEAELSKIIGLKTVKDFVRTQYKMLIAQEKRRKANMVVDVSQSLNMIFSGNPGTGKTTIARIVAKMFKDMGFLKSGNLVEVDKGDLVAEYVGQTTKKTENVFKSALGGVLFIDEAYSLAQDGNSFGREAIDTLVKLIEDFRGDIVVILAGYKKEMKEFLKSNSGLQSRFPLEIEFPDYQPKELFEILLSMIKARGFVLDESCKEMLTEQVYELHKRSNAHSGNGRLVRNYLDGIIRRQSSRIATADISTSEMNVITDDDILDREIVNEVYDLEKALSNIIGLKDVKNFIRSLSAKLRLQNERKKMGLAIDNTQTLHMIFKGNPGTGKTMMARTIADVLYNIGVLKTNKLIETDRSELVAGYVGQTAIKTREVIRDALDGVLFIDEAYALSQGGENDFGREAIDTLVKLMDDNRERLVVILAGYSGDMDKFLQMNAGLKSRFPNIIEFKDYSVEELLLLSANFFKSKGYVLVHAAQIKLKNILTEAVKEPQFGNGRYIRNLFERAVNNQALRLSTDNDLTREELITIEESDIEKV